MEATIYALCLLTKLLTTNALSSNSEQSVPDVEAEQAYILAISEVSGRKIQALATGLFDDQLESYAACSNSDSPSCFVAIKTREILVFDVTQVHFANLGKFGTHPLDGKDANTTPIRWRAVSSDLLEVTFETRIWFSDVRHTVQEPLLVDRTRGPLFR